MAPTRNRVEEVEESHAFHADFGFAKAEEEVEVDDVEKGKEEE
jgi:hypothetical protein